MVFIVLLLCGTDKCAAKIPVCQESPERAKSVLVKSNTPHHAGHDAEVPWHACRVSRTERRCASGTVRNWLA